MKLAAILTGSFLAALMLRHLTCIMAAEATGWKELFREYMNVVYNAWFANAIILFILNGLILFAPLNNPVPLIVSGLIYISHISNNQSVKAAWPFLIAGIFQYYISFCTFVPLKSYPFWSS